MSLIKRRLTKAQVYLLINSGLLVAIGIATALALGDTALLWILLSAPFMSAGVIWLIRRSMAKGRTAEEIFDWWFHIPILGPTFRLADRINSRMGYGSKELLDASRRDTEAPCRGPDTHGPT